MSAPFVHLHVHSEYSILDGACRIPALVDKAARLEMPAVSLTDHGSLAGAIDLYRNARKAGRQAHHRLRGLRRRRPAQADEGHRAPDASRRDDGGIREPDQALLPRLPGGLLLPPPGRLGAVAAVRAGADCALRLPFGPGLEGDHRSTDGRRRDGARPAGTDLRARQHLRGAPERRARDPAAGVPALCRGSQRSAGSHSSPRATSTTSTRPTRIPTRRSSASSRATR